MIIYSIHRCSSCNDASFINCSICTDKIAEVLYGELKKKTGIISLNYKGYPFYFKVYPGILNEILYRIGEYNVRKIYKENGNIYIEFGDGCVEKLA